jgi:CheY-like chemotaxis protein
MYTPVIVHIDDDMDDQELLEIAFRKRLPKVIFIRFQNGVDVIHLLDKLRRNNQLPDLIVLDINMPFLTGNEVAKIIKDNLHYKHIPVVIFSTSPSFEDKLYFENFDITVIPKPFDLSMYDKAVSDMIELLMRSIFLRRQKFKNTS